MIFLVINVFKFYLNFTKINNSHHDYVVTLSQVYKSIKQHFQGNKIYNQKYSC